MAKRERGSGSSGAGRRKPFGPLGHRIHHAIEDEIRRRIASSPGGHLVQGRLGELVLQLSVDPADPEAGAEALSGEVERALARYVADAVHKAAAFRPGRAFCHRCESADCRHAAPPEARSAFAGYTPTGFPRWTELGQLFLDLRHPQVDRFYDEGRAVILAQEVSGADLKADLLPEFHRSGRHHDVAGQICAGLFPLRGLEPAKGVALTFQAVVTRQPRGRRHVGLNVIGGGSEGEVALAAAPPESKPWRAALLWAEAQLADLSRRAGGRAAMKDTTFQSRVEGILQGLARRIERDARGRGRRTHHAQERHLSGSRPTRKAIDDLRAAAQDSLFLDRRNDTFVVLGARGRTHFFAPDGRLVSSVHYPKETLQRKIRLGHWKPASTGAAGSLRARVEESTLRDGRPGDGERA
jgi:hypothetical protein